MQNPGFHENKIFSNKEKQAIARSMLERYTGSPAKDFEKHVLLTNFDYYLQQFQKNYPKTKFTSGTAMQVAHCKKLGVSLVDFNIGSPTAALIIELLSTVNPTAVVILGMCGGLHRSLKIGDFIIPMAAIRGEGVSTHFLPPEVPALPTFKINKFVSEILVEEGHEYRTGVVHSTDYRFWEFSSKFKETLYAQRVIGIEMECAALFIAGFASKVPIGSLLLVSDLPLQKGGIKTNASAKKVFKEYSDIHLQVGVRSMAEIADRGEHIRHYKW